MDTVDTKVIRHPSPEEIEEIGAMFRAGKLIAIPTETVYGLGADGLDPEAMTRIYEAKGRPSDNPLILHVPDEAGAAPLVKEITPTAKALMDAFWPGPLTLTLEKSDIVPDRATGGLPRVALRCPNHALCHDILKAAGVPVAAPSANISGRPSPTTAQGVYHDMKGRIDLIVDDGPCPIGVESTVVEVGDDAVTILRPGGVTADMLRTVVSSVSYDTALRSPEAAPKAPGMKYKHYAPDAEMQGFVGDPEVVAQAMSDAIDTWYTHHPSSLIGCLCSQESVSVLQRICKDKKIPWNQIKPIIYGRHGDAAALAHQFYEALLSFNEARTDFIVAEGVPLTGLGVAVMNRMDKATAHHVTYLDTKK